MNVLTLSLPPLMTNCYIVYEREGGKCFIIDPASCADKISTAVDAHRLKPKAILLTHGHFDHISAADKLREKYRIPLYIHEDDLKMIASPSLNCSKLMMGIEVTLKPADKIIKDGDLLKLETVSIKVIHTPGHSPGSCVFLGGGCVFSGDTVFRDTYGRYDLPGGNYNQLINSIKRVMSLDPNYEIYPGHNEKTTIAREMIHY